MSRRKKSEDPSPTKLITSAHLCEITSYTDVHHREAAKKGYFPAPKNGLYETIPTLKGLFKRERDLRAKAAAGVSKKREEKLDKENVILDMDIAERRRDLASLDDMDRRFRPMLVSIRQKILASTLTDEEKDELITEFGHQLTNALTRDFKGGEDGATAPLASDLDQASETDGK